MLLLAAALVLDQKLIFSRARLSGRSCPKDAAATEEAGAASVPEETTEGVCKVREMLRHSLTCHKKHF